MSHSDSCIPDDMANEILAEASRLHSEADSGYSREELQQACSEAGMPDSIFQKAVQTVKAKRQRRPTKANRQRLEPINLDNQTICWSVWSGRAVDVKTYAETRIIPMNSGFGVVPYRTTETVIKLSIKKENGAKSPVVLRGYARELQVREGQRVSALWGHIGSRTSHWLFFMNHSDCRWCWVSSPSGFFKSLDLFQSLSGWWLFASVLLLLVSLCLPSSPFFWPLFLKLSGVCVGIIESSFCVGFCVVQRIRAWFAWHSLKSRVIDMVGQLDREKVL